MTLAGAAWTLAAAAARRATKAEDETMVACESGQSFGVDGTNFN